MYIHGVLLLYARDHVQYTVSVYWCFVYMLVCLCVHVCDTRIYVTYSILLVTSEKNVKLKQVHEKTVTTPL